MAPVTIRPARAADLPAVLRAYAEAGIDSPGETLTPAEAEVLLARFAQYPDYTLYVAEAEGGVVGTYALLVMDNLGHGGARSGVVEDVAVLPEAQGLGVGRAMMQHAMDTCAAKGCYKLALSSNAKRTEAHEFYQHLGFTLHGYSFGVATPPPTAAVPVSAVNPMPVGATPGEECDVCGGPTYLLHCKQVCRVCGYTRDCSDP